MGTYDMGIKGPNLGEGHVGMGEPMEEYNGAILASASYDHTIRFWDVKTGLCTRTLQHSDSQVNSLAITPDRNFLAAAGYQHIRLYDVHCREASPVIDYEGVVKNVTSVGFARNEPWMFTGGEDCTARIWDYRAPTLQNSRIFQVSQPVNSVCLHPNQVELVVGDQGGSIHLWDLRDDRNEQLLPVPGISIQHVDVDAEGHTLAAVSNKGQCFIWNMKLEQITPSVVIPATPLPQLQQPLATPPNALPTVAETTVAVGSQEIASGQAQPLEVSVEHPHQLESGMDNEQALAGQPQETSGTVEAQHQPGNGGGDSQRQQAGTQAAGQQLSPQLSRDPPPVQGSPVGMTRRVVPKKCFAAHKRYALKCRFSPDSTVLCTTSGDNTAAIWNSHALTKIAVLQAEKQRWVWDCAFTMDSKYLATASSDSTVRLWSLHEGPPSPDEADVTLSQVRMEYRGHQKAVTAVALSDMP